jgi:hypothetical protein
MNFATQYCSYLVMSRIYHIPGAKPMSFETIILIIAFILFAIPSIKALLDGRVDFTNSGLACVVLAMLSPAIG